MLAITKYNKTIVAIVGGLALIISQNITDTKWAGVALSIATALGVFSVPNKG